VLRSRHPDTEQPSAAGRQSKKNSESLTCLEGMARVRLSRKCRRAPTSRSGRPARRRSRSNGRGEGAGSGREGGTMKARCRARGTTSVKTLTASPSAVWPWHLAKRPARRGQKTSNTSFGCRRSNLEQQIYQG
jgi:hypothetical protein